MAILALHGGAGGDGPWRGMTALDPQRLACMERILNDLGPRLEAGEINALEAVTLAVESMEDEPLYNAGRGSVLAADERVYMDASIMQGSDQAAGSVVNVESTRHPIRAAHLLLKEGWPVMLNAAAADAFAEKNGLEQVDLDWLKTDLRQAQWTKWHNEKSRPGSTDEDDEAVVDGDTGATIRYRRDFQTQRAQRARSKGGIGSATHRSRRGGEHSQPRSTLVSKISFCGDSWML